MKTLINIDFTIVGTDSGVKEKGCDNMRVNVWIFIRRQINLEK